jgi:MATE family, multidrug efflux pump
VVAERVSLRQVLGLAVPALGVLAAEPLYLLVDTAVVGHLGAVPLGALSVGAIVLAQVSTQLVFLSYGTTARTARLHGAGRRTVAVAEGVQATWLALTAGLVLVGVGQLLAVPIAELLAGRGEVAGAAVGWLRIALCGTPFILVTMAGNGWMRGVQDAARPLRYVLAGNGISALLCPLLVYGFGWGLEGSAIANVTAQVISASMFLRALHVERVPLRPEPAKMRAQLALGRDLVLRSLAFQACFVSATTVAAHHSTAAVGAHQIVLQLWSFLAMVLDSLAIAAQSLVGAALGGGDVAAARRTAWQVSRYGLGAGIAFGVLLGAGWWLIPAAFTSSPDVQHQAHLLWPWFAGMQPVSGVVFALDGVLIGAGDLGFMRTITLAGALGVFVPVVWLALHFGWGIGGVWAGLAGFIVTRFVGMTLRAARGRWAVTGTGPN